MTYDLDKATADLSLALLLGRKEEALVRQALAECRAAALREAATFASTGVGGPRGSYFRSTAEGLSEMADAACAEEGDHAGT